MKTAAPPEKTMAVRRNERDSAGLRGGESQALGGKGRQGSLRTDKLMARLAEDHDSIRKEAKMRIGMERRSVWIR